MLRTHWPIWSLLAVSLFTHLAFYGNPPQVAFDEVHFGKFMTYYLTGEYYYDIHPPLGKLLYAAVGALAGVDPSFTFPAIGKDFPDRTYLLLRALPTIAGILLPLVVFAMGRELGIPLWGAWLAGMLAALDNALVVQSRLILLDAYLLLFGFTALWLHLLALRTGRWSWLAAAAVCAGLAMSIKWTGMAFAGIIGLVELLRLSGRLWPCSGEGQTAAGTDPGTPGARVATRVARAAPRLLTVALLPVFVYWLGFAVHFALLPKSGPGDAFMTAGFQKTLEGNSQPGHVAPIGALDKFVELNREMWRVNATITADHQYTSKWYSWPFMFRPIYYWTAPGQGADQGRTARVYLLGNPLVWWLSTWAVLFVLVNLPVRLPQLLRQPDEPGHRRELYLACGFLVNFVPFMFIGRIMFLYHYFPALVFALLITGHLAARLPWSRQAALGTTTAAALLFLWFAPLTWGLPITETAYQARVWFKSWL